MVSRGMPHHQYFNLYRKFIYIKFHLNGCVSYYSDHKHNVISQHAYLNFELLILKQKFTLTIKKSIAIQT